MEDDNNTGVPNDTFTNEVNNVETPKTELAKPVEPVQNTRVHLLEFIMKCPELIGDKLKIAGFKAFVGAKEWMKVDEWEDWYKKYKSRK